MYGLDPQQFRKFVIRPVLERLKLHTPAAENLLLGTALQESRLKYIRQLGTGPAIGVMQMEPATHEDIWDNFLRYQPELAAAVKDFGPLGVRGSPSDMAWNLAYAVAMARVHYRRVKAAVPGANDPAGLAAYWKQYYNTPLGAGTVEEALPHFRYACAA
jgi:hypothetical protein